MFTPGPNGQKLLTIDSAAVTAAGNTADIPVAGFDAIAIDLNVSAVAGTSTPTITFSLQRKAPDGNYCPIWTGAGITAAGNQSITVGKGYAYLSGTNVPAAIGSVVRLAWVVSGTTPSFTFSGGVQSA